MSEIETLRRAYAGLTAERPLDGSACPDADDLLAVAEGRLEPARRDVVAGHLAGCARCAAIVAIADDVRAAACAFDQGAAQAVDASANRSNVAPLPAPPRRSDFRWLPVALAAALALAVVPALWLGQGGRSVLRGTGADVEPRDGAVLAAPPLELRWPGAAEEVCRATLRTAAAQTVLAGGGALGARQELDADTRAQLLPGDYIWTVDCGTRRLGPYAFRIESP